MSRWTFHHVLAALHRLIEVEKLAGRTSQAERYATLRDSAEKGLAGLMTDERFSSCGRRATARDESC